MQLERVGVENSHGVVSDDASAEAPVPGKDQRSVKKALVSAGRTGDNGNPEKMNRFAFVRGVQIGKCVSQVA